MTQPVYTAFAGQAIQLADIFQMFVGQQPVAGTDVRPFVAALSTPDGPSTGAGVQSLQHITFSRDNRTFVVGSLDPKQASVELRGYATVASQYKERFGEPMPISVPEYEAFTKRVRAFCGSKQLVLVIRDTAEVKEAEAHRPSRASMTAAPQVASSRAGMWIAIALMLLVAGGIAAAVVLT